VARSPRAHVYKLTVLLALGIGSFLGLMRLLTPSSWDYANWYRRDSVAELAKKPLRFAGNESCAGSQCHEQATDHQDQYNALADSVHESLSCEGCHGALSKHVRDGKRIESARISPTIQLCLNCHAPLVSRPEKHTTFDPDSARHKRKKVTATTPCKRCHDPHDP
jgi:hypothetical protein